MSGRQSKVGLKSYGTQRVIFQNVLLEKFRIVFKPLLEASAVEVQRNEKAKRIDLEINLM